MRLIAISGKMGSGKDTITNMILEFLKIKNIKCKHLKFADCLKKASSLITSSNLDDNYNNKDKMIESLDLSIGRFQQLFGTTIRENIHEDIWIFPVIEYHLNNPDTFCIISDCRFKNEANFVKKNGGLVFRINRDVKPEIMNDVNRDTKHISETDMDDYTDYDLVINNNSSIDEIKHYICEFIFRRC